MICPSPECPCSGCKSLIWAEPGHVHDFSEPVAFDRDGAAVAWVCSGCCAVLQPARGQWAYA